MFTNRQTGGFCNSLNRNQLSGFYLRFFDEIERGGVGSQRFWGFEGRKNRGKGGAMELARVRFAGRFWHAKHLYKDCAPKGVNCLQVWHGRKLLDLIRLAKVS